MDPVWAFTTQKLRVEGNIDKVRFSINGAYCPQSVPDILIVRSTFALPRFIVLL